MEKNRKGREGSIAQDSDAGCFAGLCKSIRQRATSKIHSLKSETCNLYLASTIHAVCRITSPAICMLFGLSLSMVSWTE